MQIGRLLLAKFREVQQIFTTLILRNNTRRWLKVAKAGVPPWDKRNKIIAHQIAPESRVIDLGAGAQTLREYIPRSCIYQPCDLVMSTHDVILCDFNSDTYPAFQEHYDYVVCSGVIEYIRNVDRFFNFLPDVGKTFVVSYNTKQPSVSIAKRLSYNWVNHYSEKEIEGIFESCGFSWSVIHRSNQHEIIYKLNRCIKGSD